MTGNAAEHAGSDLVCNVLEEEYTLNRTLSGDVAHVSLCCNGVLPVSAGLPLNDCTEDTVSNKTATRSDAEEGGILKSSCKLEKSGNKHMDKDLGLNVVTLNGKFELPIKAAILKKKRKLNRKRSTNTLECATLEKKADLLVELHEKNL